MLSACKKAPEDFQELLYCFVNIDASVYFLYHPIALTDGCRYCLFEKLFTTLFLEILTDELDDHRA